MNDGMRNTPKCPKCKLETDSVSYNETGLIIWDGNDWVKEAKPDIETFCCECGEKICLDETGGIEQGT